MLTLYFIHTHLRKLNWSTNEMHEFRLELFFSEHLVGNCRLPWDQRTELGYFGEIVVSVLASNNYIFFNGLFLLLFVSLCFHHRAFYQMVEHSFHVLQRSNSRRIDKLFLSDQIRFHIIVREYVHVQSYTQNVCTLNYTKLQFVYSWFLDSADVYSPQLVGQMICCVILLASTIFQLDLVIWFDRAKLN